MRRFAFLAASILIACGDSTGPGPIPGVTFTVNQRSFAVDDTIIATLRNGSQSALVYCPFLFEYSEHWVDGAWISTRNREGNSTLICDLNEAVLEPGESARSLSLVLGGSGLYRLRADVEWPVDGETFSLFTSTYRIVSD